MWTDSINNLYLSIKTAVSYPAVYPKILYLGKFIEITNLPWHYLLVWIAISTPVLYLSFFFIGIIPLFKNKNIYDIYIFTLAFVPLIMAIFFAKTLINGWRHFYFIYPFILYICILGIDFIFRLLKNNSILNFFLLLLILFSTSKTAIWMSINHPYQMVYFNYLAEKKVQDKFELDYWGLSNKDAIRYIIKRDKSNSINIFGMSRTRLNFTMFILSKEEKDRINIVDNENEADYIITNYNGLPRRDYFLKKNFKIFNEIKVDNIIINSTFKK